MFNFRLGFLVWEQNPKMQEQLKVFFSVPKVEVQELPDNEFNSVVYLQDLNQVAVKIKMDIVPNRVYAPAVNKIDQNSLVRMAVATVGASYATNRLLAEKSGYQAAVEQLVAQKVRVLWV